LKRDLVAFIKNNDFSMQHLGIIAHIGHIVNQTIALDHKPFPDFMKPDCIFLSSDTMILDTGSPTTQKKSTNHPLFPA
jgi:hypothetical protein